MGRGRAKAKQTKVARELKYNSGGMDLDRLRADLIHEDDEGGSPTDEVDPELLAKYGDLADVDADAQGTANADSDTDEDDDYPHEGYATR